MAEFPQDVGYQRHEVFHPITNCFNHKHSNWQGSNVLLELKVPVHRQERIEFRSGEPEKLSILDARPPALLNGGNRVTNQQCRETTREILIKQDAHRE